MNKWLYIFPAAALVSGCAGPDYDERITGPIEGPLYRKIVETEASADAELESSRKLARALAEWSANAETKYYEYHVGVEDTLELNIMSLEEPGKLSQILRTVNIEGNINLPWIGDVEVKGLKVSEVEDEVKKLLDGKYIKNPQVNVSVSAYKSAPVVVTGAVSKPGIYYLNRDKKTVLEVLAQADGLKGDAGAELLIIKGGATAKADDENTTEQPGTVTNQQSLIAIDLQELIDEGDLKLNVSVEAGDILNIIPRQRDYVYVLGHINRPGMFEVKEESPLGVVQAVALAGGLKPSGRPQNSTIIRETDKAMQNIPVNIKKIMAGDGNPVYLQPGDTLFIGSSILAKIGEFIKPTATAGVNLTTSPVP